MLPQRLNTPMLVFPVRAGGNLQCSDVLPATFFVPLTRTASNTVKPLPPSVGDQSVAYCQWKDRCAEDILVLDYPRFVRHSLILISDEGVWWEKNTKNRLEIVE